MLQLPTGITSLNSVWRGETKLAVEVSYVHEISPIESKKSPTKDSVHPEDFSLCCIGQNIIKLPPLTIMETGNESIWQSSVGLPWLAPST